MIFNFTVMQIIHRIICLKCKTMALLKALLDSLVCVKTWIALNFLTLNEQK